MPVAKNDVRYLRFIPLLLLLPAAPVRGAPPPVTAAFFDEMPKPALLPDGTLAAYFLPHRGPGVSDTPDRQTMTARFSRDGGRTWSVPEPLFSLPAEEGGFGYFVVLVDQEGEVHFFVLCDAGTGVIRLRPESESRPRVEPLARQRLDVWHVRSTGRRTGWTEPKRIWKGRAGDPQSVIQLRSGRILFPLAYLTDRNWGRRGDGFLAFTYMGQFDTTFLYSDDGGATWHQSPEALRTPTPGLSAYGAVEPIVLELKDGRVWALLRTQMGRFYESFSTDGVRWSGPRPSNIFSSDSPAGLVRLQDGRICLIWNNCLRYPYAQGARNVLHAAVSDDEGRTWRGMREILRDPHRKEPPPPSGDHGVSYPFPTLTASGDVLYSLWVQSGQGRTLEMFDPAWLDETRQDDGFDSGLEQWSAFGTQGVEVISHERSENGSVLKLQKVSHEWPASAVWNFPSGRRGTLRLRIRSSDESGRFLLGLTDHFSVPFDLEDRYYNVFNLVLGRSGDIRLPELSQEDSWHELELQWDTSLRGCSVILDGDRRMTLPLLRDAEGVCYLRLRSMEDEVATTALLVDRVIADVSASWSHSR